MNDQRTTVRGLSRETHRNYRRLAAARAVDTGESVSMNDLYIEALEEYAEKPENVRRLNGLMVR